MSYMHGQESDNTLRFYPKNRKKVKSDAEYFVARSTWEYKFMAWCDQHPDVLLWTSEEIFVPYINPLTKKNARYFPDMLIKCKTKSGKVQTFLVEIKPSKECKPPKKTRGKSKKTFLHEENTWKLNKAKWQAAKEFCFRKNIKFIVITEKKAKFFLNY